MVKHSMDIDYIITTSDTIRMRDIIPDNKKIVNMEEVGDSIYLFYHEHVLMTFGKESMDDEIDVWRIFKSIRNGRISAKVLLFLALSDTCRRVLKQKYYDKILNNAALHCFMFNVLNEIVIRNDLGIIIKEW